MDWITTGEIKGVKTWEEAAELSVRHWEQLRDATARELLEAREENLVSTSAIYCALCFKSTGVLGTAACDRCKVMAFATPCPDNPVYKEAHRAFKRFTSGEGTHKAFVRAAGAMVDFLNDFRQYLLIEGKEAEEAEKPPKASWLETVHLWPGDVVRWTFVDNIISPPREKSRVGIIIAMGGIVGLFRIFPYEYPSATIPYGGVVRYSGGRCKRLTPEDLRTIFTPKGYSIDDITDVRVVSRAELDMCFEPTWGMSSKEEAKR